MSIKCTDCGADIPDKEQEAHIRCGACRNKRVRDAAKTEEVFVTLVLCPVCGDLMDKIYHPEEKLHPQVPAMVSGNARRAHGNKKPQCAAMPEWIKGWILHTQRNPVMDYINTEQPTPTCMTCGRPMRKALDDPVAGKLWYCDWCYNAHTRPTNPTGWECPRCHGIHAPSVLRCDCTQDYAPETKP